jgi:hypothetical protein
MNRLPVVTMSAASLALGLVWSEPGETRQMYLPKLDNPYCPVATYVLPNIPEQAISFIDNDDEPMIVVSSDLLTQKPAYARFLLAHECCHHTLGHVRAFHREWGHFGPQPFYYIRPQLRTMEMQADCCAVKHLLARGDTAAINAAAKVMAGFGDQQTGAYYPTGQERAANIAACMSDATPMPKPMQPPAGVSADNSGAAAPADDTDSAELGPPPRPTDPGAPATGALGTAPLDPAPASAAASGSASAAPPSGGVASGPAAPGPMNALP